MPSLVHRVGPHDVRFLRDGGEAFPAMLAAITEARREVLVEMYWFQSDGTGRRFLDALVAAARRGVVVKVAYDAVGSLGADDGFWAPLVDAGGEIRDHAPLFPLRARFSTEAVGSRDHRKLVVVDAELFFTGGLNVGDPWSPRSEGGGGFRDDAISVRGPLATDARALFYESWARDGGRPPADVSRRGLRRSGAVRLLANRSRVAKSLRRALLRALRESRARIDIANAYFLPSPAVLRALARARRRGVAVRLLVPAEGDVWLVSRANDWLVRTMLAWGVRVFAYEASVLHQKTAIFDARTVIVGSANLDMRSWRYNLECDVAVDDEGFAREVREAFEADLARSHELTAAEWDDLPLSRRAIGWLAYQLQPLL